MFKTGAFDRSANHPNLCGALGRTRTCKNLSRKQVPVLSASSAKMAEREGFEWAIRPTMPSCRFPDQLLSRQRP